MTYANVTSTLALFAALAGGAYAAATIGPGDIQNDAVRSRHVDDGAIKNPELAQNSVGSAKVIDRSLTGAELKSNSIGGPKINEASLSGVDAQTLGGLDPTAFVPASSATQCVTAKNLSTSSTVSKDAGLAVPGTSSERPRAYAVNALMKATSGSSARVSLRIGGNNRQVLYTNSSTLERRFAVPGSSIGTTDEIHGWILIGGGGVGLAVEVRYASGTNGAVATFPAIRVCTLGI